MSLNINIQRLNTKNLKVEGEASPESLELETMDELVTISKPLIYNIEAQKLDTQILLRGSLELTLDCECSRCLKPYAHEISLNPWICHVPLEGDEKALIVNDSLDLTPYVREDIVLSFPQHPLCEPKCVGLSGPTQDPDQESDGESTSAWAELNKLELEE